MNTQEEYRMTLYKDFGCLGEKDKVRLVRNVLNGKICVKKILSSNLKDIYEHLKKSSNKYVPIIYECIVDDEKLLIIEEYIEGQTLEEIVHEECFSEEKTVWLIEELCKALRPLHDANPAIICRDLKAENIMINASNQVKIVDFDISRTYQEGKSRDTVLLGTAEYAAPEQFGYFQTDARTDIYSLGILMNYVRTGKFPIEEMTSGKLGQVVRKCTCMEPKERYQNVDALLNHLNMIYPKPKVKELSEEMNTDSWTIPGFRSKKLWKMIVASLGYLFLFNIAFAMEITRDDVLLTGSQLRFEQFCFYLSQILFILWICNYRNIYYKMSHLKNFNIVIRILGYILVEMLLIVFAALFCSIFDQCFF